MAKAKQEESVSVSGNVMFYTNPQPLNKEKHGKFGVKPVDKPFEFMAKNHFIPLTAQEFGSAAASYPVVFASLLCVCASVPCSSIFFILCKYARVQWWRWLL